METQKIINLLNGSDNENSRFATKNDISVRKTTFYDKSSFLKIIGDAFRIDYVCSLSSHFTY